MRPLFGVGPRLALGLAAIVALALAVAWTVVVPSLERDLTDAKLEQMRHRAGLLTRECADRPEGRVCFPSFLVSQENADFAPQEYANQANTIANARAVVYEVLSREPQLSLSVKGDSRQDASSGDVVGDPVAREAARTGRIVEDVVGRDGQQAEVAVPIPDTGFVVLFTSPLEDTLASISQVKRRLLLAGGVGLGLAALLGYAGAHVFARRLRRLERAAERIAGGDLGEPVVDRGRDEVGQLAEAFERMRRRLARLEHARREFIANASHELRTPIFSLGGFLELLAAEELDDATRREFLETMQEQVRRLEKLATDLLDLSRLDAGRLSLEVERLDLPELAEALAAEFAAVAFASGHELTTSVEGTSPDAEGDAMRTLQIGRVLVENALRHTPPGTTVRIRVAEEAGAPVLEVSDDGPGIPAEHHGQVFDRFFRLEGARASGSGLGLAIARELAGAMGGRVELDEGSGRTVFRLVLRPAGTPAREPVAAGRV